MSMFPRLMLLLLLSGVVSGFATSCPRLPDKGEYWEISSGEKALVLLRVNGVLPDGINVGAFAENISTGSIKIGLGGFDTGGEIRFVVPRFLSTEALNEGWVYFVLEPGIYYMIFRGAKPPPEGWDPFFGEIRIYEYQQFLKSLVRLRIDIPVGSPLVYVGTAHLRCRDSSIVWPVIRTGNCDYIDGIVVENQEMLAAKLAREYLANLGPPQTILMQRHEGKTIILRTPGRKQSK